MLTLEIEDIKKRFKQHTVLKDVSLELNEGDIALIQGKNGSGKTTLLKILCDILCPDEGDVIFTKREIGALIENPGFLENCTLKKNIKYLESMRKCNVDQEYVLTLCKQFNLDYDDKSPISSYSLGMRQKAGIIQAFMSKPSYLLFDEPLRGLDKESIRVFCELINTMSNRCIVVIVSHDVLEDINFTKHYTMTKGVIKLEDKELLEHDS